MNSHTPTPSRISQILKEVRGLGAIFDAMEWAEEEISKAQERHGEQGKGPIWKSFPLLRMTHNRLFLEPLCRAHCREILDRVAKGQDTRPGTDAEMMAVLHDASLVAPLNSKAACLYFRLGARSIPEIARMSEPAIDLNAYERTHGYQANDYERELRKKLRQEFRKT